MHQPEVLQRDHLNKPQSNTSQRNMGGMDRFLSTVIGGGLLIYGARKDLRDGILSYVLGAGLIYRGATGHCPVYELAGIDTGRSHCNAISVPHGRGVKVESIITVNKTADTLYQFWRNPENLPRFMSHLAIVRRDNDRRSHWQMKSLAGITYEWDAAIINDKPNQLIAWRSLDGADLDHAGSVRFELLSGNRGTEVKVTMEYRPPAGKVSTAVAKLFGEEPGQVIEQDLRRFKQLMEAGEIASVEGQPHG